MAVQEICNTCKCEFIPSRCSKGLFCSQECYWNSKKRKSEYICKDCGVQTSPVKSVQLCKACEVKRRRGKAHHAWTGSLVGYSALHSWIRRELGTPNECECCGVNGDGHDMHWANISGEYKRELSDWMRLCPQCHKDYDLQKISFNKENL